MLTIEYKEEKKYTLTAADIVDGEIYEAEDGCVYIGNQIGHSAHEIIAFGLSGHTIVFDHSQSKFRKINATLVID